MNQELVPNIREQRFHLNFHIQDLDYNVFLLITMSHYPFRSKPWKFIYQSLLTQLWVNIRTVISKSDNDDQSIFKYLDRLQSYGILGNEKVFLTDRILENQGTIDRVIQETNVFFVHLTSRREKISKQHLVFKDTFILTHEQLLEIEKLIKSIQFVFFRCEELLKNDKTNDFKVVLRTFDDKFPTFRPDKHLKDILTLWKFYEDEDKRGFQSRT